MSSRLFAYRDAIATTIKNAMPDLKEVSALSARFDLAQLKTSSFRTPAAFVVLLRTPLKRASNGALAAEANVAVFAVTGGKEEEREAAAFVIAEAVAVLAGVGQMWSLTHVGPVENLDIEQVHAAELDRKGVACIAVTFRQRVNAVGSSLFTDEEQVPTALYVNGELVDEHDGSPPDAP